MIWTDTLGNIWESDGITMKVIAKAGESYEADQKRITALEATIAELQEENAILKSEAQIRLDDACRWQQEVAEQKEKLEAAERCIRDIDGMLYDSIIKKALSSRITQRMQHYQEALAKLRSGG